MFNHRIRMKAKMEATLGHQTKNAFIDSWYDLINLLYYAL